MTSARFHPGELIISNCVKCLVILAWGPSIAGLLLFDTLLSSSQFQHSNLSLPRRFLDTLERIMVTPCMHRCHHSVHRNCCNTNFSTILSIWDRIGKSYHLAGERQEMELIDLNEPRGAETMQMVPFLLTPVDKKSNAKRH